jgi:hypothetical protein
VLEMGKVDERDLQIVVEGLGERSVFGGEFGMNGDLQAIRWTSYFCPKGRRSARRCSSGVTPAVPDSKPKPFASSSGPLLRTSSALGARCMSQVGTVGEAECVSVERDRCRLSSVRELRRHAASIQRELVHAALGRRVVALVSEVERFCAHRKTTNGDDGLAGSRVREYHRRRLRAVSRSTHDLMRTAEPIEITAGQRELGREGLEGVGIDRKHLTCELAARVLSTQRAVGGAEG